MEILTKLNNLFTENSFLLSHIGVGLMVIYIISDSKLIPNQMEIRTKNPLVKFLIFYFFFYKFLPNPYLNIFFVIIILIIFEILNKILEALQVGFINKENFNQINQETNQENNQENNLINSRINNKVC